MSLHIALPHAYTNSINLEVRQTASLFFLTIIVYFMEKVPHFEDLPIMTANLVISVRELTKRISDLEKKIVSLDPEQLALKPKHKPLTSREVCQLIHKSPVTLYRMVARGEIPYFKQGKTLGFYEDEIYTWLDEKKVRTRKELEEEAMREARELCLKHRLF